MLKKRTFFWAGGLLCLLVLAGRGIYLYMKPHEGVEGLQALYSVDADSLYLQYQRDEQGANRKYLGKVLEVKGRLSAVEASDKAVVWVLEGPQPGGGVSCQLFDVKERKGKEPHPGDMVRIKGRCTGFLMDVNLTDCVPE